MAYDSDGTAMLKFGTTNISGWVVASVTEQEQSESLPIQDEGGDIITHISNFGKRVDVTLELIAKTGTTPKAAGESIVYTDPAGTSQTIRILGVGAVQTIGDVAKHTITGVRFAGVTVS